MNRLTWAQLVALGGEADGKVRATHIDELRPHIEAFRRRQRPDVALAEAEEMLNEELRRTW